MNTDLLAISNIFAGTNGIGRDPVKPTSTRGSNQFSPSTPDNTPLKDTHGTETADNPCVNPQNGHQNGTPSEFDLTTGAKVPQKGENGKKAAKQNLTQIPAEQPSLVQAWLAQYSLNIEQGKEGVARKVEPKAGYELAQSLKNLRQEIAFAHTVQPTKTQISETVPIINQNQIGLKTVLPVASKKPSDEGELPNGIRISNTKLAASRGDAGQQSSNGLALKALADVNSKITTANEKPAVVPTTNTLESQKIPPLTVEGLTPKGLVDADSRITAVSNKGAIIAGKPVVPDGPKVPETSPSLLSVHSKSSGLQPLPVRIDLDKSPLTAENVVGNKDSADRPGHPGIQQPSGPLVGDILEQGENVTGKSLSRNLHDLQLQVCTGQIKEHGSSASNNKSDSGFEQIISANNATIFFEEQSSPFPDSVTTDNLPAQTSPSDVSASITKQILESIHSSSSQEPGTQQITIRLNPPELGKVFIKFEEQENQITGLLEVSKAQTRYEVEQTLPHIIQNLADSGIQVKKLEVMLTDQSEQQPYRDESLQDGTFQQHHEFSQENNPDDPGFIGSDVPVTGVNNNSYQGGHEQQMQITDSSINILI
ncbi:MAG: hypothetical protein GWN67_27940 [Phycisphaerae bacterium]|nr:flagellar hook-length control protein FliK [Phycisphaerae bacterium]NIP55491.1 flagellar hook-length control protein FliK [Phycisphaerae bacterium]NIS51723.1 flagellar hook-length control protein FliK [Phycisphaerae bacterium]NIU11804.1 flagellar hook-length control protein FliK [Phycisphaerae bacterium]NIU60052.1 hypothetical protein [Phycisphaerae bacterium]